jgi:hypothetical protein
VKGAAEGVVEVLEMAGRREVVRSTHRFENGRFQLTVPATARLRVRVDGRAPQTRSVFMDYEPLLRETLEMTAERLSDWGTFEKVREELGRVKLEYEMEPAPPARLR